MANMISNPGLEVDATGWTTGANYTISRDTVRAHGGAGSLKNVVVGSGAPVNIGWKAASFGSLALSGGVEYAASAWVYIPSGWGSGRLSVALWEFVGNTEIAHADADLGLLDQWQLVTAVGTPAASTANGGLRCSSGLGSLDAAVAGDSFWVDDAYLLPTVDRGVSQHSSGNVVQAKLIAKGYSAVTAAQVAARIPEDPRA